MRKLTNIYFVVLKIAITSCLAAMVFLVFTNVIMRYVFNTGIPISEEFSRWCFVWLTFLGAILVLHEKAHLGVDIVQQMLSFKARKICNILSTLIMLYITWLIFEGSLEQTLLNLNAHAPATGLSLAWLFGVGIVFAVSTGFILLGQLYFYIKTPANKQSLIATNSINEG